MIKGQYMLNKSINSVLGIALFYESTCHIEMVWCYCDDDTNADDLITMIHQESMTEYMNRLNDLVSHLSVYSIITALLPWWITVIIILRVIIHIRRTIWETHTGQRSHTSTSVTRPSSRHISVMISDIVFWSGRLTLCVINSATWTDQMSTFKSSY